MTLRLRVLKVAEADLAEASDWYGSQDETLRYEFIAAVGSAISRIRANPDFRALASGRLFYLENGLAVEEYEGFPQYLR
jgi:hypothetical protein